MAKQAQQVKWPSKGIPLDDGFVSTLIAAAAS